uniref:Uncharacterized protein n=1 Tax=Rhizophora mucronata TaxID=61149 RepID=A0A2P2PBN4_RHIMU
MSSMGSGTLLFRTSLLVLELSNEDLKSISLDKSS